MAKKIEGIEAVIIKKILNKKSKAVIDVEGEVFVIQRLKEDTILSDIETDIELKDMLERADKDILNGRLYSSDELLEAIEKGDI
ncbi:hypothetical protein RRV45_20055 [Bacillus sp. DTU_2020_1000418_1_SI_GHA_SEK_038]|uniref:hypothetical protein n=1 Tax=Bacillus sp. DTU_2020_1000418_1_SI_GHA_SEK_038 TaxID=3077585 RepID=UPI0028E1E685|nr:hypothetical protein [Bacillus sp. DTU_2020_1000418_1_SI_GHA_SEK_038]WNS75144.1 hypothetical protein RRV45_20055 [Bacillus sp. DTU_2020_1000418_1_SI_GHA_SEK_038]